MLKIQQFTRKKPSDKTHRSGKKVLCPRNSSWYAWYNHAAWDASHRTNAAMPTLGVRRMVELGRYKGRKTMYQRKYYECVISVTGYVHPWLPGRWKMRGRRIGINKRRRRAKKIEKKK